MVLNVTYSLPRETWHTLFYSTVAVGKTEIDKIQYFIFKTYHVLFCIIYVRGDPELRRLFL